MQTAMHTDEVSSERRAHGLAAGGSMLESVGGLAVVVLAILALAGVAPAILTAIAGIVFGASMLVEGSSISGEYARLSLRAPQTAGQALEMEGGSGIEVVVGIATVALGILSLIGISASSLLPVLVITGGVGLILSAGTMQRLNDLNMVAGYRSIEMHHVNHGMLTGAAAAQTLAGIAAAVLGILSLVAIPAANAAGSGSLPQVGMLVLGAAIALSGGAIGSKMSRIYSRS